MLHILVNPNAAHGKAGRKAAPLIAAIREQRPDAAVIETPDIAAASGYIRLLDHRPATVVAVGGDGTLNRVGHLLVDTPHTLGVIPAGTGNDYANLLGLKNKASVLSSIIHGSTCLLDTGMIEWQDASGTHTHSFLNSVGIGFDAAVAGRMKHSTTGSGILPYLVNVFRELNRMRLLPGTVRMGTDVRERNLFLVAVGNGTSSGGGFKLTPHARPDDGLLDLCIVSNVRKARVLRVLPETLWGGHLRHPEIEYLQTESVHIGVPGRIPIHADGEYISGGATGIGIEVRTKSLKILMDNRIMWGE